MRIRMNISTSFPDTDRPQLKHLHRFKKEICPHWYNLGVQLLDDSHVPNLDSIQENYQKDVDKCCTKMFQLWLEKKPSACWNDLLDALTVMELLELSNKIRTALVTS